MNNRLYRLVGVAVLLLGLLTACPTPVQKGSINLSITGIPTGSSPNVVLSNATGFSRIVSASAIIPDLEAGLYSVQSDKLLVSGAEFTPIPKSRSLQVKAGETAILTVNFTEAVVAEAGLSSSTPEEVQVGGVYRRAYLSDYLTLNPFISAEADSLPSQLAADGLFELDPISRDYRPYMASSYTVSSDGLTYTVKVRRGMKWSDGSAITPDDWVTTWKIHTDIAVGSNSYNSLIGIASFTKPDADTLVIVFKKRFYSALETLGFTVYPSAVFAPVYAAGGAAAIRGLWNVNENPANIISSGAFKLKSYSAATGGVLERNQFFGDWNKDSAGNPLPYLGQIQLVKGKTTTLFTAGLVDVAGLTGNDLSSVKTAISGGLDAVLKENYSAAASSNWIVFNMNRQSDPEKQRLFRSTAFRQAMSHLTNRAKIISDVYGGAAEAVYTGVYPVFRDWVSSSAAKFDYNIQAAKTLLATLGYSTVDANGYLTDSNSKVLEFNLSTNAGNVPREAMAQIFSDAAKLAGVKVNLLKPTFNTLIGQMTSTGSDRPFDAILLGLSGGGIGYPLDSNTILCTAGLLHIYNLSGACLFPWETQMETKFNQGLTELDLAARIVIAKEVQNLEAAEQPFVYLVAPRLSTAWRSKIKGEYPSAIADGIVGTRSLSLTWVLP